MSCHIQSHKTPCALCHSSLHQREPVLWNRKRGKSTMKWGFGNELFSNQPRFSQPLLKLPLCIYRCSLCLFACLFYWFGVICGPHYCRLFETNTSNHIKQGIHWFPSISNILLIINLSCDHHCWLIFSPLSVAFCAFADNLNAIIPNTLLITCDWQCLGICASCSYHPFMQRLF